MCARYFREAPSSEQRSQRRESPWSGWIRQTHRSLAILFTLTVAANFLAMTGGRPPAWITYSPLPPLFLMLLSGLYMFALPHVAKRGREP